MSSTNWVQPSRRTVLALLGAGAASGLLGACKVSPAAGPAPASAEQFLAALAWKLIELIPEGATSLGIDTGTRAALRGQLGDRSPRGTERVARLLRDALKQIPAYETEAFDPATRTSLAVVKSAFSVALEGFAFPYGDVAVGGWRNTPYVVIQNVGAYLDTPRFLDAEHPVRDAGDAEAYLSRLAAYPAQLDGELERISSARRMGLVPPAFLLDKAIRQMELSLKDAFGGGDLARSLARRTAAIPGEWERRAQGIAAGPVAAALARQLEELKRQRAKADDRAGLWARPKGDEWYAWGLRASTTTRRTPDEVHAMGLEQVALLQGRMDPILKGLGFTKGTVGERMTALGTDPRFLFSNDDKGRAEIIAVMQSKVDWMRKQAPRAFRNPVRGNLEIRRPPQPRKPARPAPMAGRDRLTGRSRVRSGSTWATPKSTTAIRCQRWPSTKGSSGTYGKASMPTVCR